MVKGTTSSGFTFEIPEGLDTDFRFIKAYTWTICGDEDKAMKGVVELVSAIFANNEEEEKRLYEHLGKKHDGRVPFDVLFAEINEIIEIAKSSDEQIKN